MCTARSPTVCSSNGTHSEDGPTLRTVKDRDSRSLGLEVKNLSGTLGQVGLLAHCLSHRYY